MTKEKVIIFEGEHLFVAPKNYVVNKKTGMANKVSSEMNVVAPIDEPVLDKPIEAPKQPDEPTGYQAQQAPAQTIKTVGGGVTAPAIQLGDPTKLVAPPEEVAPPPTTKAIIPLLPISFGAAPMMGGGGGGKQEAAPKKKSLLAQYWWVLLVIGVGGYIYYKKKK